MARRGPTRKKRSQEELRGMVWQMQSEETCDEAVDAVMRSVAEAVPYQPFNGVLAPEEDKGTWYLVYLIGKDEEPNRFPISLRTAIIRGAGGVLCTNEALANRLKNKRYLTYRWHSMR